MTDTTTNVLALVAANGWSMKSALFSKALFPFCVNAPFEWNFIGCYCQCVYAEGHLSVLRSTQMVFDFLILSMDFSACPSLFILLRPSVCAPVSDQFVLSKYFIISTIFFVECLRWHYIGNGE